MDRPSRDEIIEHTAEMMYGGRILNNSHRGDVVEAMVSAALDPAWKFVGLGWHPWDLQRGRGADRVRMQIKQVAALQLWGPTKKPTLTFGWKSNPPSYFKRDNPDEAIEDEGWFCEVFVFGLHLETDVDSADQVNVDQWQFLVIPAADLETGQNSKVGPGLRNGNGEVAAGLLFINRRQQGSGPSVSRA